MYFDMKSYLKSNRNYIAKHTLNHGLTISFSLIIINGEHYV